MSNAVEARNTRTNTPGETQTDRQAVAPRRQQLTDQNAPCHEANTPPAIDESDELKEHFDTIRAKTAGVFRSRRIAIENVRQELGEKDAPPLEAQVLGAILTGALGGVSAAVAARAVRTITGELQRIMENAFKDTMDNAVQSNAIQSLVANIIGSGGSGGRVMFFSTQLLAMSELQTRVESNLGRQERRYKQALRPFQPGQCRDEEFERMKRELIGVSEALDAETTAAFQNQHRASLSSWMRAQAQRRLGTTSTGLRPGEQPGTDMTRAVAFNARQVEGVITVDLHSGVLPFESYRMDHFSRIRRVSCTSITSAVRENPAMQSAKLGDLQGPIVITWGSARFGRNESNRYWADPGLTALTRATGASTVVEGARLVFERYIAEIPFSRVEAAWTL